MAFFKFRKAGEEHSASSAQPQTVEVMRKRARHRLVGATVLVLLGVIGFPLLFDKQPRPVAVDLPIDIPDKNKAKPLAIPAPVPAASESVAPAAPTAPASAPAVPAPVATPVAPVATPTPAPTAAPVVAVKPEPKAAVTPTSAAMPAAKAASSAADAAKAQALLDGKPTADKKPEAAEGRFVVQVGAFTDVTRAREARLKLEQAGLKTYTQVVQTGEVRKIRVRVGPFPTKAEADKAAAKIKKLDLPAAILTL
jgi:DedD protein